MKILSKLSAIYLLFICVFIFSACGNSAETSAGNNSDENTQIRQTVSNSENQTNNYASQVPNLQAEILAQKNTKTDSPLGAFDFKNHTFPFPRGWQDSDSKEFTLEDGKRPVSKEKIGVSYVTTLYGDATGDRQDEAFVILKIDTGGSAIPQIVYVFSWKDSQPELIWNFRTGDRADGGLKNIWTENGSVVIELYGQDRYILGDTETMKITGDEEQISFPAFYTKTIYKWNGNIFRLEGKRLTYKTDDENAPPVENMNEIVESQNREKK
ncbi:hypothetical protein BH20ACI4_BH20ACI4_30910 [soil metagenome]